MAQKNHIRHQFIHFTFSSFFDELAGWLPPARGAAHPTQRQAAHHYFARSRDHHHTITLSIVHRSSRLKIEIQLLCKTLDH